MHSSTELSSEAFAIERDREVAQLADVLPGSAARGRLGIVVREPCGAVGASCLLLAAVTSFYDAQRALSDDFFIYPDYFTFHVGRRLGDHSMLEVWPSHKEVVVDDDAEAILEAVNDRAIDWLLVPDGAPGSPPAQPEALASARCRIAGALAYSPAGRVAGGDVRVSGNEVTESYVRAVLDPEHLLVEIGDAADPYAASVAARAGETTPEARARLRASREDLLRDGHPVETYRRLTLDQALALLVPGPSAPDADRATAGSR
ncbi:MAG: hypothetical protein ACRDMJ_02710 [Solirubrobacteraceae bacterium]